MTQIIPMIEARKRLMSLPHEFEQDKELGAFQVTRHGKPVMAILPNDLYETIMETLEVMGDDALVKSLRQSIQEAKNGKIIPWDQLKQELTCGK